MLLGDHTLNEVKLIYVIERQQLKFIAETSIEIVPRKREEDAQQNVFANARYDSHV